MPKYYFPHIPKKIESPNPGRAAVTPKGQVIDEPAPKPNLPTKGTKVLCGNGKVDSPETEYHELERTRELTAVIADYDDGATTPREASNRLVELLFDRDHTRGEHWDYGGATVEPVGEGESFAFAVEKSATWDWQGIYRVATAKGTVTFLWEEDTIRIENYSYNCAG